ncbi:flagellar filament capping protein FliD [Psychromonas sp. CD1]|uniref:flagellar filament capping protein FliD n=1 Tax=Psychromonas sp. CD1 TaxID=1979839 RepID=UPI000B9AE985|nr:flagellar filament capping protein FliD [Psychromonas sp. CD1]
MSSVTSTGLGSGLDINSIVGAIVGAEKEPALSKITKEDAKATAIISAYGLLNSDLDDFKSSYKDLAYRSTFSAASANSSDSSILDTKLGVGAQIGSWQFEVKQKAQAQVLVSSSNSSFSGIKDTIGEGVILLRFGHYNSDASAFSVNADKPIEKITIDSSNNSLEGLRNTINKGDYSVSASIVNDGNSYRLVLTSKATGKENALEITVADTKGGTLDKGNALNNFIYTATHKNLDQTSVAQDAKIVMNGIEIVRDSNKITNVIQGVTLNINGETALNKKVTLKISSDNSKVKEQIEAFVKNYNATFEKMNELTAFNGVKADNNGVLNGDSTIRNIKNMMRSVLNTQVKHIQGSIHSFADLGILTKRDGTLELNASTLDSALNKDMQGIADFFTATGVASDTFITFDKHSSLTKPGTYSVEVSKLATQATLSDGVVSSQTPTVNDDNNTFKIRIDGYLSNDIVLSQKTYASIDDLAIEIQLKINSDPRFIKNGISISVRNDAGKLTFTSNKFGSGSSLAFNEVGAGFYADFGVGVVSAGVSGTNVQGKIDGKSGYGDGQYLLSEKGDSTGIKLLIEGGLLGSRGDVTYAEGMTKLMNNLLSGIIDSNISGSSGDMNSSQGIIDGKIDSLYKKIASLDTRKETLIYRMDKLEARLYKSFNSMDMAVSTMGNTMTNLKNSLKSLPGYTRD